MDAVRILNAALAVQYNAAVRGADVARATELEVMVLLRRSLAHAKLGDYSACAADAGLTTAFAVVAGPSQADAWVDAAVCGGAVAVTGDSDATMHLVQ